MTYGYNIGASSVLTSMFKQDVAANNLANLETVGFKPDSAFTIPRQAAREEDGLFNMPSNAMLERLGAGVLLAPVKVSFAQGPISKSTNGLDVAIEGDGFLQVGLGGGSGPEKLRLTRDGRMTLNAEGRLVLASNGLPVLDEQDRAITVDRSLPIVIDADGSIRQGGSVVAKLKFVDVPQRGALRKTGDGLFAMSANAVESRTPATGRILQNAVERSAVDPIQAMMAVQSAANAVSSAVRIMQVQDELTGRAINALGRVSA